VWRDTPLQYNLSSLVSSPLGYKGSISNNMTSTLPVPTNDEGLGERVQLVAKTLNERLQRVREKRDRLIKEREL